MPIQRFLPLFVGYFKIFRPWFFFIIFFITNVILCYFPLPFGEQGTVLFFGIICPLLLACHQLTHEKGRPPLVFFEEFLNPVAGWLWFVLAAGVIFVHLYKLESLFVTPIGDEGLFALFGLQLSEKWHWDFFYTVAQHSPLLIWFLSFSLRFFKSPFLGFWSAPTFFSLATVFLNYFVLRVYFSKSFSFLAACFWGFSLCSFYCGRLCLPGIFVLPWELTCFGMAAVFSKETQIVYKKLFAVFFGILTGLGYFTFPSWPVVSLSVVLITFVSNDKKQALKNKKYFLWFVAALFLALVPFIAAIGFAGYGEHIGAMSPFNHWFSWKERWESALSYVTCLFWGVWGGFNWQDNGLEKLNPFLGAGFFLGFIQMYRYRSAGIIQWIGWVFILCLLPGLLSGNYEIFRIIQVFPFLILITSLGFASLMMSVPRHRRLALSLGLILISLVINGYEVLQIKTDPLNLPQQLAQSDYPIESIRAYKILKGYSEKAGAGFIFTEFMQVPSDNCLLAMTYNFNAAENPNLDFRSAQWAGFTANSHYYSFLSKRFPEAIWYWVHDGRARGPDEVLGIVPINKENFKTLFSWVKAHHYFRQLSLAFDNISEEKTYQAAEQILNQRPSFCEGDRFLESCYWERRAQFYYDHYFEVHYNDQVFALRQAIDKGYPAAHLYYELGCLLLRKGNFAEARSQFQAALRIEPGYGDVLIAMRYLNKK